MPQMAPMMWLTLMMFFIITMIMMIMFSYFLTQPMPSHSKTIINIKSTIWKWWQIYSHHLILHLTFSTFP